jgi:spore maturation protein CgeB
MTTEPLKIVILGLSITSSWGNGHATTYRALVRGLEQRSHQVLFLERDMPWYAAARDQADARGGRTVLYRSLDQLKKRFHAVIRDADLVVVGSYVPDGIELGQWVVATARGVTAFYDIDTPVTLAALERGDSFYLTAELIQKYQLYLSFTGGPILKRLEQQYGAPMARALYCAVDADLYRPLALPTRWDLGYMGTYSADRQQVLQQLLLEPANRSPRARMVVAGPQYPSSINWPANVERIEHLAPCAHPAFYNQQTFTLNLTRANMVHAGYSPSIRLFEAAACGCPIISDWWEGLDDFFKVGDEILVTDSPEKTLEYLFDLSPLERELIGQRARERVLSEHTAPRRAAELEGYARQLLDSSAA